MKSTGFSSMSPAAADTLLPDVTLYCCCTCNPLVGTRKPGMLRMIVHTSKDGGHTVGEMAEAWEGCSGLSAPRLPGWVEEGLHI